MNYNFSHWFLTSIYTVHSLDELTAYIEVYVFLGKYFQWKTRSICELPSSSISFRRLKLATTLPRVSEVIPIKAACFIIHHMNWGGTLSVHIAFQITSQKITARVKVRRKWWPRSSIAKTLRKAIRNDTITKMLMNELQNLIFRIRSSPKLLEESSLVLNTHTLKKKCFHDKHNGHAILSNNDSKSYHWWQHTFPSLLCSPISKSLLCTKYLKQYKQFKLKLFWLTLYII
jgi:hypothetical protein